MSKQNNLKVWDITLTKTLIAQDLLIVAETKCDAYQKAWELLETDPSYWREGYAKETGSLYKENPQECDFNEVDYQ